MLVGGPGERWAIDLTGPHPAVNGYKYMMTAICCFSKFGVCIPIRNKEVSTVAKSIVDHIFLQWGMCHEILTDLGKEFEAELLNELLRQFGISNLKSSGYRPQMNGVVEVWHRTLKSMLAKVVRENQRDWPDLVPYVVFCYNATEHSATAFCTFFIFTGWQPLWNVDLLLPATQAEEFALPEYAARVTERLVIACRIVRENSKTAAESASKWYNKKSKPRTFSMGDLVRVYYPRRVAGRSPKWQSFYCTEVKIIKQLNDVTFVVQSKSWKGTKVIHIEKLKLINSFP